jgi:hypothetical protein
MLGSVRKYLTYSNVMVTVLTFVVLGGGAYAAVHLKKNSVKSKQIKDGQVMTQDLAEGAIGSREVADGSLQGADIDESTLGEVPNATDAGFLGGSPPSAYQVNGSEGWHELQLNSTSTVVCHWANYGGGFATASYFRDQDGMVHLRGLVQALHGSTVACGGSGTQDLGVGFLPPGYRPEARELFTVTANDKPGRVDVQASSPQVFIENDYPDYSDAVHYVSLDGITFRCAPSGSDGCP